MNYKTEGYELYKDFNDCVHLIEQELMELEDKKYCSNYKNKYIKNARYKKFVFIRGG
jgi:hypothetical protein